MLKRVGQVLTAALMIAACEESNRAPHMSEKALATTAARGSDGGAAGFAGASGGRQKKWTGIQSCSGHVEEYRPIDKTSTETAIDAFNKSKTSVSIKGITIGPSSDYSCAGLAIDGIVTMADDGGVWFESASQEQARQSSCTSPRGKALIVGWLDGYDVDLRSIGGPWSLMFGLRIEEEVHAEADAGFAFARVDIRCNFDLDWR